MDYILSSSLYLIVFYQGRICMQFYNIDLNIGRINV